MSSPASSSFPPLGHFFTCVCVSILSWMLEWNYVKLPGLLSYVKFSLLQYSVLLTLAALVSTDSQIHLSSSGSQTLLLDPLPYSVNWNCLLTVNWSNHTGLMLLPVSKGPLNLIVWCPVSHKHHVMYCIHLLVVPGRRVNLISVSPSWAVELCLIAWRIWRYPGGNGRQYGT